AAVFCLAHRHSVSLISPITPSSKYRSAKMTVNEWRGWLSRHMVRRYLFGNSDSPSGTHAVVCEAPALPLSLKYERDAEGKTEVTPAENLSWNRGRLSSVSETQELPFFRTFLEVSGGILQESVEAGFAQTLARAHVYVHYVDYAGG